MRNVVLTIHSKQVYRALGMLLLLASGAAAFAQAGKPTIVAPASNGEIRGDGSDGKNIIRFTTSQPSDFLYYVDITEVDQVSPTHPALGSTVTIAISSGVPTSEGNNTYSFAFNFNRSELASMGSGRFQMVLRAVGFTVNAASDPVQYFKGRPLPSLTMNADRPNAVIFNAAANDPDSTPDFAYVIHFVRRSDHAEVFTINRTASAATQTQANITPPALVPGVDYDVTLDVTDTLNQSSAAGQGLKASTTIQVHANAPPTVAINGPSEGQVFQAPSLPHSVDFTVTPTDDAPGVESLQVDTNGDDTAEATGSAANGASTVISVPINSSAPVAVRVRGTDDKDQVGPYTTRTIRVNTPPTVTINAPPAGQVYQFEEGTQLLVPVNVTATDTFSTQVRVDIDLNFDGVAEATQMVDVNVPTTINVPIPAAGSYTLTVKAIDGDGALSAVLPTREIRANSPPTVTVNTPNDGQVFQFVSGSQLLVPVNVTATDTFSTQVQVDIDLNFDGTAEASQMVDVNVPTTINVPIPAAGGYILTVKAIDGDGRLSAVFPTREIRANAAPTLAIQAPANDSVFTLNTNPKGVQYTVLPQDDFSDTVTVNFDTNNDGTPDQTFVVPRNNVSQVTVNFTAVGPTSFAVWVTDSDGAESAHETRNLLINDVPSVAITSPEQGTLYNIDGAESNQLVTFTSEVTDTYGTPDTLHWTFFDGGTQDVTTSTVSHFYTSLGVHQAGVTATDTYGASSAQTTVSLRINDIPQAWLRTISLSVYDSTSNTYLVQQNAVTSFTLRGYNRERDNNPLRLKFSSGTGDDPQYTLDDPPADASMPHEKDIIALHTYDTPGDYVVRFDVGETINGQDTTGTLTLNVRVVEALPTVNAVRNWNRYR